MPKRDQLLDELKGENDYGVLLMVQMDGVPDTLQAIIATTQYDDSASGLRDKHQYIVRAVGVKEHQVSVGMFKSLKLMDDHPLSYAYNTTPVALFFRGTPKDTNELVLDLFQGYASTFGPWRQIPEYLNTSKPLVELLSGGGDLLGQMPLPLAERLQKVLEHHGLETKLVEDKQTEPKMKVLTLDESYIMALDFTIESFGNKPATS